MLCWQLCAFEGESPRLRQTPLSLNLRRLRRPLPWLSHAHLPLLTSLVQGHRRVPVAYIVGRAVIGRLDLDGSKQVVARSREQLELLVGGAPALIGQTLAVHALGQEVAQVGREAIAPVEYAPIPLGT